VGERGSFGDPPGGTGALKRAALICPGVFQDNERKRESVWEALEISSPSLLDPRHQRAFLDAKK